MLLLRIGFQVLPRKCYIIVSCVCTKEIIYDVIIQALKYLTKNVSYEFNFSFNLNVS